MPSQYLYELLNYGSIVLIVAAIVVGVAMTKGTLRGLLVAALVVTVLRDLLNLPFPTWIDSGNQTTAFAYGLVQWLLVVSQPLLLVAAAVAGARKIRAKDAAIAALVDATTPTWQQPKHSPDPKLFVE